MVRIRPVHAPRGERRCYPNRLQLTHAANYYTAPDHVVTGRFADGRLDQSQNPFAQQAIADGSFMG